MKGYLMFRLEDYLFYNQDYCFLCKEEKALKLICKNCYDSLELINGEFNLDAIILYFIIILLKDSYQTINLVKRPIYLSLLPFLCII